MSDWVFSQRGSVFVARYETDEANVRALDEKMKQFNRETLFYNFCLA